MTDSDEMCTKVPKKTVKRGYGGRSAEQLTEERRQRLMASALELFGTVGYLPTTVEKLCSHAKVSTRHFYEHFEDRESLLIAVFEAVLHETRQLVLVEMMNTETPLAQRFARAVDVFFAAHLDDPRRARITTQEILGVSQKTEASRNVLITEFAYLIEAYMALLVANEQIPARNYRILAFGIVGAMHELQIAWLHQAVPQARVELCAEVHFLIEALMRGAALMSAQDM